MNETETEVENDTPKLVLNIINLEVSDHSCYIIRSELNRRVYIGYTVNFTRRLRQHNGEITGGAKRTSGGRPWYPICHIKGFYEATSAMRFEYRLQHSRIKRKKGEDYLAFIFKVLQRVIDIGDISKSDNQDDENNNNLQKELSYKVYGKKRNTNSTTNYTRLSWPVLKITWYDPHFTNTIIHDKIINDLC